MELDINSFWNKKFVKKTDFCDKASPKVSSSFPYFPFIAKSIRSTTGDDIKTLKNDLMNKYDQYLFIDAEWVSDTVFISLKL